MNVHRVSSWVSNHFYDVFPRNFNFSRSRHRGSRDLCISLTGRRAQKSCSRVGGLQLVRLRTMYLRKSQVQFTWVTGVETRSLFDDVLFENYTRLAPSVYAPKTRFLERLAVEKLHFGRATWSQGHQRTSRVPKVRVKKLDSRYSRVVPLGNNTKVCPSLLLCQIANIEVS